MKEFMLFIKSEGNPIEDLSLEQQQEHVKKVGSFITKMVEEGHMTSAQPLEMEGRILSYQNGEFVDGPFIETKEVISGYYHLLATDLNEAIQLAKQDPRFEDGDWAIEIRPVVKVDGIN